MPNKFNEDAKRVRSFKSRSKRNNSKGIILTVSLLVSGCAVVFVANSLKNNSNTNNVQNTSQDYTTQYVSSTTEAARQPETSLVDESDSISFEKNNIDFTSIEYEVTGEKIGEKFQYGGHSYQLFCLYDVTGNEVIAFCNSQGGYWAHINDESENHFLASTLGEQGYKTVYFGYSDEESEGDWKWIDDEYSTFVNWRSGEPNNEAGVEHYALISPDGTWNDGKLERDSKSGIFILCEWNTPIENNHSVQNLIDFQSCILDITASSQLASETYGNKTYEYSPQKVVDNDMSTCWSEGTDGYGLGESITLYFDYVYEINELCIWNGLCTSEDLFYKNSRLRYITVVLSNGDSYDFECPDGWDNRKTVFKFNSGVNTSSLTIIIKGVYAGEKYKDTCISEISVS